MFFIVNFVGKYGLLRLQMYSREGGFTALDLRYIG